MQAGKLAHPTVDELAAFSAGRLDEASAAGLAAHVDACAVCRAVLKALPPDELDLLLRESASCSDTPLDRATTVGIPDLPHELLDHPRYHIVGKLGAGGMGVVYKAEHRHLERPVALKILNRELLHNPSAMNRFRREVKAVAQLAHPSIAAAYDADQAGEVRFLVMEFIEGTNLACLVKEQGPLSLTAACGYVRQVALALDHAHQRGIVHRDIKPSNLMRTPDGTIKVLDFGLAVLLDELGKEEPSGSLLSTVGSQTNCGQGMGTPDFVAPEQRQDAHAADIRSDIYSLGCTLRFLLTGRSRPSATDNTAVIVPTEVQPILARMVHADPAERYQTPREVVDALTPFVQRPVRGRRRRWLWVAAAAVLVAAGVAAIADLYHPQEQSAHKEQGRSQAVGEVRCFRGHTDLVRGVAVTPDGRHALSASFDKTLRLWDLATGTEVRCFKGHTDRVICVALSPDGKQAVSGGFDAVPRYWDVATGQELGRLQGHKIGVHGIAFSHDGKKIVTGGLDHVIRVWDASTLKTIQTMTGHRAGVQAVCFSTDDRQVISGSGDGSVRIWDVTTGAEAARMQKRDVPILTITLSPEGSEILSGDNAACLSLWDMAKKKEIRSFPGHWIRIVCVAFSPDGNRALSTGGHPHAPGQDCTLRLWDVKSGRENCCLTGHTDAVNSVAFLPDGNHAVSASEDQTVRLWKLPPQ